MNSFKTSLESKYQRLIPWALELEFKLAKRNLIFSKPSHLMIVASIIFELIWFGYSYSKCFYCNKNKD